MLTSKFRNSTYWISLAVLSLSELALLKFVITGSWKSFEIALTSTILFVVNLVAVNVLTTEFKDSLTFWKWENPLPGTRIFSKLIFKDSFIDVERLKKKMGGSFPTTPKDQNAKWYSIYKMHKSDSTISDQNQMFVLLRDMVGQIFVYFIAGAIYLTIFYPWNLLVKFTIVNFVSFLLVSIAGKNRGNRFALTVLAHHSSQK